MSSSNRESRGTRRRKFFTLIIALLSSATLATVARGQGFSIEYATPRAGTDDPVPLIQVAAKKNNQVYDTVVASEGGLRFKIKARGQCPNKYNLTAPLLTLYSGAKQGGTDTFPINSSNRSLGGGHGQEWNYYNVGFPYIHPQGSPVAAGNAGLKQRVALGESLASLLQKGFTVSLDNAYVIELSIDCDRDRALGITDLSPLYKDRASLPAVVRCMPTGYAPTTSAPGKRGVKADPMVASVLVAADPAETKGRTCPASVNFKGRIVAGERTFSESVKVRYRFLGDRGFKTDYYDETLRRGETKPLFWRRTIEAPARGSSTGELAAPGVKPKLPIYEGWMMLEVLHPDGVERSEKAPFTVDCNPLPQRTPPPRRPRLTTNE